MHDARRRRPDHPPARPCPAPSHPALPNPVAAAGHLAALAEAEARPEAVAAEAGAIASGWWWNAAGEMTQERLLALTEELRRWCAVAASHYALRWDHLHRAGRPDLADRALCQAQAMDLAWQAIAEAAFAAGAGAAAAGGTAGVQAPPAESTTTSRLPASGLGARSGSSSAR